MKIFLPFTAALLALTSLLLPLLAQDGPTPASTAATAPAPIDPAKAAEIRKLLALSGTAKLMDGMKTQMFAIFEKQHPQVPPHVWQELEDQMNTNELLDQMLPVYDRNFSLADLQALNAFYQTPAGQRMLSAMPNVMHESMAIGEQWGKEAAAKVAAQLQKERGTAGVAPGSAAPAGK